MAAKRCKGKKEDTHTSEERRVRRSESYRHRSKRPKLRGITPLYLFRPFWTLNGFLLALSCYHVKYSHSVFTVKSSDARWEQLLRH